MKVLFVTPEWPYPLDQGGRIRMYYFLRHLAQWHELHLVSVISETLNERWLEAVRPYCHTLHLVYQPDTTRHTAWRILASLWQRRPYILARYLSPTLLTTVQQVVNQTKPDRIIVESQYISDVVQGISVPSLVDLHDVATILYERFAGGPRWELKKAHGYLQKPLMQHFEVSLPHRFNRCITASATDQQWLQRMSGAQNIDVVPNGVDTVEFYPNWPEAKPSDVVFVGSMDYYPNIDAALFLAQEIMPLIWRKRPETTLFIVGRNPAKQVQTLAQTDRIHVTGTVVDVRPYLAGAGVVIIPLRSGSGTRLKALMAAAMGKVIVGTPIGLEGLDLIHGQHILVAEGAENLAEAVLRLLNDPVLSRQMGTAAHQLVEKSYSWEACAAKLNEVLQTL